MGWVAIVRATIGGVTKTIRMLTDPSGKGQQKLIMIFLFIGACFTFCVAPAAFSYMMQDYFQDYYYPMPDHTYVSSHYGPRDPIIVDGEATSDFHHGTDFPVSVGTIVRAVHGGTVIFAGDGRGSGGIFVRIKAIQEIESPDGTIKTSNVVTEYLHCSAVLIVKDDEVMTGQPIALSGNTGISTGPHLHLAIWIDGKSVDPELLLQPWTDELRSIWFDAEGTPIILPPRDESEETDI